MGELRHIAVVGGGISGLAAAHRITELRPDIQITLFEASARLGGVLQTERRDGFLIEHSADNFITNVPWGIDLCRRLGLGSDLLGTDPERRKAYVVSHGRLEPVPEGFVLMMPSKMWPMVTTPILSVAGKLRMVGEFFIPPRVEKGDESLESFVVRRFGQEVFDRLVQPLIGGIYTADPAKLSMQATLPRFLAMESEHGSIIRGAQQQKSPGESESSGARYGMFVAPRDGMDSIIGALAKRLPSGSIRLSSRIEKLERRQAGGWRVQPGDSSAPVDADAVIVALPAPKAAALLDPVDGELSGLIGRIPYAGASILVSAYRKSQIKHPLDGFGFVVPAVERRRILATSFSSVKFPGRAPDDCVVLRTFVGGALQPEMTELSDASLKSIIGDELKSLLGITDPPLWSEVVRWNGAMPQYHVGHVDLVAKIRARVAAISDFELCGNAYDGVGVPVCIHSAELAVERILGIEAKKSANAAH